MNIEGKDVSEIIEHLKTKFDDGARWIAYQKDKESIGKDDLHFFSSCNDAQKFCKKSPSAYFLFRYSTIANVIDKLNNNDKQINYQRGEIYEAFSKLPLGFIFDNAVDEAVSRLCSGKLMPVWFKKEF